MRILRHWRTVIGVLALLPSAWKGVWGLLGYGGSIDFLIERSKDPSWLSLVMDASLNPPAWANLPLIVTGLLFIWWDAARRTRGMPALAGVISAPQHEEPPSRPLPSGPLPRASDAVAVGTSQERVFVPLELTPDRLFSFYEGLTNIQANELTRQYIGQRITVCGTVRNVRPWADNFSMVTVRPTSEINNILDNTSVTMLFRDYTILRRLMVLARDEKITATGKIIDISRLDLLLDNCELVAASSEGSYG